MRAFTRSTRLPTHHRLPPPVTQPTVYGCVCVSVGPLAFFGPAALLLLLLDCYHARAMRNNQFTSPKIRFGAAFRPGTRVQYMNV